MGGYSYNARYKAEVAKFGKRDGFFAICFFVFYCVAGFALGLVWRVWHSPYSGAIFGLVMGIACFVVIGVKKDGLASIGLHKGNLWPAIRLGLLFGLVPLVLNNGLLPGFVLGWEMQTSAVILLLMLIRTFILAAHEDMIFVGYIQTRLYGLMKHDILAVLIGAILFSVMHIMPQLGLHGIGAFNAGNGIWLLVLIPQHIVFNALFRRYHSLYPTMILHTIVNGVGQLWRLREPETWWSGGIIYLVAIVLAVGLWTLYLHRKDQKLAGE